MHTADVRQYSYPAKDRLQTSAQACNCCRKWQE